MRAVLGILVVSLVFAAGPGRAQEMASSDPTLADIRQEMSVLYVEIQRLKRELSTTGSPSVQVGTSGSVLDRVASIEAALQALTARTEKLEFRVNSIVRDGTNRLGDLEFRLVELEGGDVSQLAQTTTLGGEDVSTPVPVPAPEPAAQKVEMAISEEADFDAALASLEDKNFRQSADALAAFVETYPGSPLAAQAYLARGKALTGLGDTREAARAYLAGFSADPTGPVAADALVELGVALGGLGQVDQACLTLAEVPVRFPKSDAVGRAQSARSTLGCS